MEVMSQEQVREKFSNAGKQGFRDEAHTRLNAFLLLGYLLAIVLTLSATFGLFLKPSIFLGLPAAIVYLGLCAVFFCLLAIAGYFKVFLPWAEQVDGEN